jgi:hypothetical protein
MERPNEFFNEKNSIICVLNIIIFIIILNIHIKNIIIWARNILGFLNIIICVINIIIFIVIQSINIKNIIICVINILGFFNIIICVINF